jgi:ubiquinone/menaquinone biosynthesis C-methylase UbiE
MTERGGWVRDTRFGAWLVTSDPWARFVVRVAFRQLLTLLGRRRRQYEAILDVGCGAGPALPLLDRRFGPHRLVGVDPDPEMIASARRAATHCRCRVDLKVGDAAALELADESLDMIFCHQTFHHVVDPEGAAREFYRVLKPGGVLLFSESCAPFIRSWLVRMLFRHPMAAQRLAEEYLTLLRRAGFSFDGADVSTPYPWWSRPDLGVLERLGRPVPAHREETVVNVVAFKAN